jgi:hypothetical protein
MLKLILTLAKLNTNDNLKLDNDYILRFRKSYYPVILNRENLIVFEYFFDNHSPSERKKFEEFVNINIKSFKNIELELEEAILKGI